MIDKPVSPTSKTERRLSILDALRFFLAFWVTMGHFGVFPLFAGADTSTRFGYILVHGWSSIVWGIPAVIGFFVISGFCIHLPFRHQEKLTVGRYYARRYVRILIPVAAAIALMRLLGDRQAIIGKHSVLWNSVLWSLFCEEIYYAVYPLARLIRNRSGWRVLLVPTFIVGATVAAICPNALDGSVLGTIEAAVVLFPIWLLGCLLAEQSDKLPSSDSSGMIWMWRTIAWLVSWVFEMIYFKEHVPLVQVLLCFGVIAYFWIKKEIAFGRVHKPWAPLASAGLWSYSLYLIHGPAMKLFISFHLPNLGFSLNWCASFAFILVLSYLFYLVVERPSHRLARKFMAIRSSVADTSAIATRAIESA